MRTVRRRSKKKPSVKQIEQSAKAKLLSLKRESKKRNLKEHEKLWIARTFGLEQFISAIHKEDGSVEYMVVISCWQIIDLAEKTTDGENGGDFTLRRNY